MTHFYVMNLNHNMYVLICVLVGRERSEWFFSYAPQVPLKFDRVSHKSIFLWKAFEIYNQIKLRYSRHIKSCIFYPLIYTKIVIMIYIACISKGNDDCHDGTICRSSTSHVASNLVLSGISLPNTLYFKFWRTSLSKKLLIFTTCYFPVDAYRWFEFIVSWRISFQFLQKVSTYVIMR